MSDDSPTSGARQAAAGLAQQQARARKRRTVITQVVIGVVLVVAVLVVTLVVLGNRDDTPTTAGDPVGTGSDGASPSPDGQAPPEVTADGAFVVGNPDAEVAVQVVEDFQCPACQQFEAGAGDLLDEYAAGDEVKVEYRGIAFLDQMSTTDYSSRALNASACTMSQGQDVWSELHRQLFLQQPPEGGDGLPDATLVDLAVEAGADADVVGSCIEDRTYDAWTAATTDASAADGITSTPTILVDGEQVQLSSLADLSDAVDAALGR